MQKAGPTKKATPIRRSEAQRWRRIVQVSGPAEIAAPLAQLWLDGQEVVLGREPPPGGWRLDDEQASRQHARLALGDDGYVVEDVGSTNHTFVDGRRVERTTALEDNAVLRVGQTVFVYEEHAELEGVEREKVSPARSLALEAVERLADRASLAALPGGRGLAPVVILGPTGAGKERLARRIHDSSGRQGAWVPFNCGGALDRALTSSALFGHTKGAFTGADAERAGAFREAHRGTLFLDEVGELPMEVQPVLLRALQEGKIQPQGASTERAVDVRIVVATHRDLEGAVSAGRFREDLWARLAFVVLQLPGLAERRVEILPLLRRLAQPVLHLTELTAEALVLGAWPQNVRGLEALAVRLGLHAGPGEVLEVTRDLLPTNVVDSVPEPDPRGSKCPTRVELEALLAEHAGNAAAVARALGTRRSQVYRWCEYRGLKPESFRKAGA